MLRFGLLLTILAALPLVAGGCTGRHVASGPGVGDLRHDGAPDQTVALSGPRLGAADACGGVLWERGPTSMAFLLRPGLPDMVVAYHAAEPVIEPMIIAAVPTP